MVRKNVIHDRELKMDEQCPLKGQSQSDVLENGSSNSEDMKLPLFNKLQLVRANQET